jgi:hypothetical protein
VALARVLLLGAQLLLNAHPEAGLHVRVVGVEAGGHEDGIMAAGLTDGTGVPTPVGFGVTGEKMYATAP